MPELQAMSNHEDKKTDDDEQRLAPSITSSAQCRQWLLELQAMADEDEMEQNSDKDPEETEDEAARENSDKDPLKE